MQIKVRFYGHLQRCGNLSGLQTLEVSDDITLGQLLRRLNVSGSSVAFATVNGIRRRPDYRLEENDEIFIFPYVSGG